MDPKLTVALMFKIGSLLIGVPSAGVFAVSTYQFFQLQVAPPSSIELTGSGDSLLDLLLFGPKLIVKALGTLLVGAKWALAALSVGSFCALIFAALLFFTSKGIVDSRNWARYTGMALAILPLLLSLLILASTRQTIPFGVSALVAAASVFVIWSLGWRFA